MNDGTHTFEELLELIRRQETAEQIVVLLDDRSLQRFVANWPMARLRPMTPQNAHSTGNSLAAQWSWLWEHRELDREDLAGKLGENLSRLRSLFEVARGNRLVYPDGEVNTYAVQYLRARIARELGASGKAQGGRR